MNPQTIRIGIDVGSTRHRVAVGLPDGKLIDEFDLDHHAERFSQFFKRIAALESRHHLPVSVAMEGYNGWARPLDSQILREWHGVTRVARGHTRVARGQVARGHASASGTGHKGTRARRARGHT